MEVSDEYRRTYLCELCNDKTYPTLEYRRAEYHDASIGAFIVRKNIQTGEETRRSVLCYQCMRKTEPDSLCNQGEKSFMSFLGPEGLDDE